MANQNDMEKLALLDSIRTQAAHCIDEECMRNCPYDTIVREAADTLRDEVHADVARELGIPDNPPRCPAKRRRL
jgi:Fe-S-cluster-containing hydrogenase component 2